MDDSSRNTILKLFMGFCFILVIMMLILVILSELVKESGGHRWGDEALLREAVVKRDSSLCDNLSPSGFNASFLENFQGALIYDDTRDACYRLLAIKLGDYSLCEKIKTGRDYCYYDTAIAGENSLACDKILSGDKPYCYTYVGILKNDSSLCEKITKDFTGGATIRDFKYFCYASVLENNTLCNEIDDDVLRFQCDRELKEQSIPSPSIYSGRPEYKNL